MRACWALAGGRGVELSCFLSVELQLQILLLLRQLEINAHAFGYVGLFCIGVDSDVFGELNGFQFECRYMQIELFL